MNSEEFRKNGIYYLEKLPRNNLIKIMEERGEKATTLSDDQIIDFLMSDRLKTLIAIKSLEYKNRQRETLVRDERRRIYLQSLSDSDLDKILSLMR